MWSKPDSEWLAIKVRIARTLKGYCSMEFIEALVRMAATQFAEQGRGCT